MNNSRRVCIIILILIAILTPISFLLYEYRFNAVFNLKINEVYLSSENGINNFIELYNFGNKSYHISDIYVSDDIDNLQKIAVSEATIEPHSFYLLNISYEDFSFSKNGEKQIYLSNSNIIIDQISIPIIDEQKSFSKRIDNQSWEYMIPSPMLSNLELNSPTFSAAPGFYDAEFDLSILSDENTVVVYTTDGSEPTLYSSIYTAPIHIYDRSGDENIFRKIPNVVTYYHDMMDYFEGGLVDKCFIIKAKAYDYDGHQSNTSTATYFIDRNQYAVGNTISIVSDGNDLFGPQGIYSVGEEFDKWYNNGQIGDSPTPNFDIHGLECKTNIEYFSDGIEKLNQPAGLRIKGGSHRDIVTKFLGIFSREQYSGNDYFDYNIFDAYPIHSIYFKWGINNILIPELVSDRNITSQRAEYSNLFLNGEYWYSFYMIENYTDELLEAKYSLKNVEFEKTGLPKPIKKFVESHDLSDNINYEALNSLIDIQSYIDLICTYTYIANCDWSETSNIAIWRTKNKQDTPLSDGRYRYCLYDLDLENGEFGDNIAQINSFTTIRDWSTPLREQFLFSNLRKNEIFNKQFVLTFMDMVNVNFNIDRVTSILEKNELDISYENYFYKERPNYIVNYLAEEFGLTGSLENVTITTNDSNSGTIIVNTSTIPFDGNSWSGLYFTDYPITLKAVPNSGYKFVGWEGYISSGTSEVTICLKEGDNNIHAKFEKIQ